MLGLGHTIHRLTSPVLDEALTSSAVVISTKGTARSPASLRRFKAAVRSFFAWAKETGQVAENPARSVTLRRHRHKSAGSPFGFFQCEVGALVDTPGSIQRRSRGPRKSNACRRGTPPGLVALLFLSTCRNYKVSDERSHRIAIQAELIEDTLSQIICVKHRR